MNNTFDIAAAAYDDVFTQSQIGRLQRNLVHGFVVKMLPKESRLSILEINCGTGHDAIWLSELGHKVIATDISSEMISVAKGKQEGNQKLVEFRQLDINQLGQTEFGHPFDLIFSDFGGLNCLSPNQLKDFFVAASKKLKPGGNIIGVIMPKNCIIENLYFLLKGNIKKAFRRNTKKSVNANVDGVNVPTWYYNPGFITTITEEIFETIAVKPIGFCIPPSYLESFFDKKRMLLKVLQQLDFIFTRFSFLSRYSDHYIILLSKK